MFSPDFTAGFQSWKFQSGYFKSSYGTVFSRSLPSAACARPHTCFALVGRCFRKRNTYSTYSVEKEKQKTLKEIKKKDEKNIMGKKKVFFFFANKSPEKKCGMGYIIVFLLRIGFLVTSVGRKCGGVV